MAAATEELVPPKRIAVNGRPIRLRWLQQIIWSFLAANIGALIISALYYLFVQLRWHIGGHTFLYLKPDWDHLFSFRGWTADRHDVRNVYEALLATLFVKSMLANWRKRDRRGPAWYVVISPFLIVVVAFPIVAAGIWLINYALPYLWHAWFAHHTLHNPVHTPPRLDWLGTYLSGFPWQPAGDRHPGRPGGAPGLRPGRQHRPAVLHRPVGGPDQGRDRRRRAEPVPAPAPLAVGADGQGTRRLDHAEQPAGAGPDP